MTPEQQAMFDGLVSKITEGFDDALTEFVRSIMVEMFKAGIATERERTNILLKALEDIHEFSPGSFASDTAMAALVKHSGSGEESK
jgi:hypothetical protein